MTSPSDAAAAAGTRAFTVVYAMEEPPRAWSKAIFAAGPTPRTSDVASWRPELLDLLEEAGYDGVVFVPEDRSGEFHGDYDGQVGWEERCLQLADVILFWVPRELATMPALTTNVEWGTWASSGKVVLGAPPDAVKNTYLFHQAADLGVPTAASLAGTVTAALSVLGDGAWRTGGERHVPLLVWRTASFQAWYSAQRGAGNTLRSARVAWTLRPDPTGDPFWWVCHVDVWVAAEGRAKTNEVVVARPDAVSVVLYRRDPLAGETAVVLVREFRSPAATVDGYLRECPGGSSNDPAAGPVEVAVAEVFEETGLRLDPSRLAVLGSRQAAGTVSAHRVHVFAVELTGDELAGLRASERDGVAFGEDGTDERTFVEVRTLAEIRAGGLVDWTTLGMLLDALA